MVRNQNRLFNQPRTAKTFREKKLSDLVAECALLFDRDIGAAADMITDFGITEDGHWYALVPDSLKSIHLGTFYTPLYYYLHLNIGAGDVHAIFDFGLTEDGHWYALVPDNLIPIKIGTFYTPDYYYLHLNIGEGDVFPNNN